MSVGSLAGEIVRFRLSLEGRQALDGIFEEPDFEAYVTATDELGAWVDLGDQSALLLKWQHLATIVVSLRLPGSPELVVRRIGF
jgi:hypothetical protein